MKEGAEWLDVVGQEFISQPLVIVNALLIYPACTFREDPGPGGRKAIDFRSQCFKKLDIFFVAVIGVIRYVSRLILIDLAGNMGEGVPDGRPTAIGSRAALHLIGGGGTAPKKAWRKFVEGLLGGSLRFDGLWREEGSGRDCCGRNGCAHAPAERATRHIVRHRPSLDYRTGPQHQCRARCHLCNGTMRSCGCLPGGSRWTHAEEFLCRERTGKLYGK